MIHPPPLVLLHRVPFFPFPRTTANLAFHRPPGTACAVQIGIPGQLRALQNQRRKALAKRLRVQSNAQRRSVIPALALNHPAHIGVIQRQLVKLRLQPARHSARLQVANVNLKILHSRTLPAVIYDALKYRQFTLFSGHDHKRSSRPAPQPADTGHTASRLALHRTTIAQLPAELSATAVAAPGLPGTAQALESTPRNHARRTHAAGQAEAGPLL